MIYLISYYIRWALGLQQNFNGPKIEVELNNSKQEKYYLILNLPTSLVVFLSTVVRNLFYCDFSSMYIIVTCSYGCGFKIGLLLI